MTSLPLIIDESYHHLVELGHAEICREIFETIGGRDVAMRDKFGEDSLSQTIPIFLEPTLDESRLCDVRTSPSGQSL